MLASSFELRASASSSATLVLRSWRAASHRHHALATGASSARSSKLEARSSKLQPGSLKLLASENVPEWLLDLFTRYGYTVVFVGVLLENAGLPVPGETVLLGGGAMAQFGRLSLTRVIVDRHGRCRDWRQYRLHDRPAGGTGPGRTARLEGRPHRRSPDPVRSLLSALRAADRVHRAIRDRPARLLRRARRRQRSAVADVPSLQRPGRRGLVDRDCLRRLLPRV